MRFHTGITATRKAPPVLTVNHRPNPDIVPEIEVAFGGLMVWLSIEEARSLGQALMGTADRASEEETG